MPCLGVLCSAVLRQAGRAELGWAGLGCAVLRWAGLGKCAMLSGAVLCFQLYHIFVSYVYIQCSLWSICMSINPICDAGVESSETYSRGSGSVDSILANMMQMQYHSPGIVQ
jgi:hypothetical protein